MARARILSFILAPAWLWIIVWTHLFGYDFWFEEQMHEEPIDGEDDEFGPS